MRIYKYCGQLVSCPHCGAIHEITLSDCCNMEHNNNKLSITCDICRLHYALIPFMGEKSGIFTFKTAD